MDMIDGWMDLNPSSITILTQSRYSIKQMRSVSKENQKEKTTEYKKNLI
jgi:hypothetical protein